MDYTYIYTNTQQPDAGSSVATLVLNILMIAAWWKLFAKAGIDGWKALIPFYNGYLQFKLAWSGKVFWYLLLISIIGTLAGMLLIMAGEAMAIVGAVVFIIMVVWLIIIQAKFCGRLAKAFGKTKGFAAGLFFLNAIFTCILAFGQNEYQGTQE